MKKNVISMVGIVLLSMISCNENRIDETLPSKQELVTTKPLMRNNPRPPLTHPHLNTSVSLPAMVYRVDSRPPSQLFAAGFTARGIDCSLTAHVCGGSNLATTGYISTSESYDAAINFASSAVNAYESTVWSCASDGTRVCRAYIYTIAPSLSNFFSVNANLPQTQHFAGYAGQQEWVAADRIYGENIISARIVQRTFINNASGHTVPAGPVTYGDVVYNDNYDATAESYSPLGGFATRDVGPTASSGGHQHDEL